MYVPVGVMAVRAWAITGCLLAMESGGALEGETHSELESETRKLEGLYDRARERQVQVVKKEDGLKYQHRYKVQKDGGRRPSPTGAC